MAQQINQKEYLKKYLGIGKKPGEKKKKKKKLKGLGNKLHIIDDDDPNTLSKEIVIDLDGEEEDAPQIVQVIDDRPPSLRVDEKTKDKLWVPIGERHSLNNYSPPRKLDMSPVRGAQQNITKKKVRQVKSPEIKQEISSSPERSPERDEGRNRTPPRRHKPIKVEDLSPKTQEDDSSPRRSMKQEDLSPRRRDDNSSPKRRKTKDDDSPSRRRDDDSSPKRRKRDEDSSPRRQRHDDDLSPRRIKKESSSPRRRHDEDSSPKRRRKDSSPARRKHDSSPKRKSKHEDSSKRRTKDQDSSPKRLKREPQSPEASKSARKSRWESEKLTKTLDGKTAGLQNASELAKETQKIKQRENELFENMPAETSGRNAATVSRKYLKPPGEDALEVAARLKREQERKEKYDRWGKGLKQVDDHNQRIQEELYEMSKPLARYADDEDLEKYLKEQEREGDPMLAYLRKKKKQENVQAGVPEKKMFLGEFMPNRFGIRPGHKWDGVDRSNGYEVKWFDAQNKKKADLEESYKWSSEDM